MDPNSNTKNVSKPGQAQSPELPGSAGQAEEPARKCEICGGPNHYGCGCEAKARKEWADKEAKRKEQIIEEARKPESQIDTVDLPKTGHPKNCMCGSCHPTTLEIDNAVKPETDDVLDDILSAEALREAHDANMNMAKNIGIMTERSGAICDCLCDLCQYFKVISEDLKTIKEVLIKKDEVKKNAT